MSRRAPRGSYVNKTLVSVINNGFSACCEQPLDGSSCFQVLAFWVNVAEEANSNTRSGKSLHSSDDFPRPRSSLLEPNTAEIIFIFCMIQLK